LCVISLGRKIEKISARKEEDSLDPEELKKSRRSPKKDFTVVANTDTTHAKKENPPAFLLRSNSRQN
jgi:hypothetical protein